MYLPFLHRLVCNEAELDDGPDRKTKDKTGNKKFFSEACGFKYELLPLANLLLIPLLPNGAIHLSIKCAINARRLSGRCPHVQRRERKALVIELKERNRQVYTPIQTTVCVNRQLFNVK